MAVQLALVSATSAGCSRPQTDEPPGRPLKTAWGEPDLSGVWSFSGQPLSRTSAVSIIVDPPDGRIPELTFAALLRHADMRERMERPPRTPADRPPETRCIVGFNSGPPMSSGVYNHHARIVQSPGVVAILTEMINDHRVIATNGGKHMVAGTRFWKGDSRGRWVGDTLVVETRNFRPETSFWGSSPNMRLTERFTRVDADTLRYRYTVDDPEAFEAPWSVEQDFARTDAQIFEYACHEGNRAMMLQMRGAKLARDGGATLSGDGWLPSWFNWVPDRAELVAEHGAALGGGDDR